MFMSCQINSHFSITVILKLKIPWTTLDKNPTVLQKPGLLFEKEKLLVAPTQAGSMLFLPEIMHMSSQY